MDWENERYVRSYTRETVDDIALSWEARALWDRLLLRFDRAGVLEIGRHGWKGLAGLVRMPPSVVERAGFELLEDGRVEVRGTSLIAPNFIDAQEAKQSDKLRQRESRARRRDQARAKNLGFFPADPNVTKRDDKSHGVSTKRDVPSQNVTTSHTRSHGVTPSLAVPSLASKSTSPTSGPSKAKAKKKADNRKVKSKKRLPLPFTVGDLVEAFKRGAGDMFLEATWDNGLAKPLTDLIRRLDEQNKTLADVQAAGKTILTYPEPLGVKWLAKSGNLFDAIAKAESGGRSRRRTAAQDGYTEIE